MHKRICSAFVKALFFTFFAFLIFHTSSHAEPDMVELGKDQGYPRSTDSMWLDAYKVGSWSAMHLLPEVKTRKILPSSSPLPLSEFPIKRLLTYSFEGKDYSVDDYLERRRTSGLLILKDGKVILERYRYGLNSQARFSGHSMTKSVVSMLVGIALGKGHIASLDDLAEKYAKNLQGSAYGATSIRHLLRMSSGLEFTEQYNGMDDNARLYRAVTGRGAQETTLQVLRSINKRIAPAGEKFAYAGAETEILGRVISGAAGRNLSELVTEWLWEPMGAQDEAYWRIGPDGQEIGFTDFSASLRDWGRFATLLANDGRIQRSVVSQQLIPYDFLMDATEIAKQPAEFHPKNNSAGYGYQIWLHNFSQRSFTLRGIYGQVIYVRPAAKMVMVHFGVFSNPRTSQEIKSFLEMNALWQTALKEYGAN